ncbi:MAG: hypothetical protein KDA79_10525, partial [Planctomycetaceae bacterium]|nr:hypothetical protein [Planctomycetaceae bacterium]
LIDLKDDGSFRMNQEYFNYCTGLKMTSSRFDRLFDGPPRRPESKLTQREMDLAASVQLVTEEIVLRMGRHVQRETGQKQLCLAGGVALNCVANGRLLREGPFEDIWIQPAAGDAGGALGVALLVWHQLLGNERVARPGDSQSGSLLGPAATEAEIEQFLESAGAVFTRCDSDEQLCDLVAGLLAEEKVVGWMQGRMEFGPRALGNRSILGDARSPQMQSTMNLKIKFRESFRPFAPSVLHNRADQYFELQPGQESPYMLLVADVREERRTAAAADSQQAEGLDRLKAIRSEIPAVTHVDCSSRVQTVDAERHGRYHQLLSRFEQLTGSPVLINTSFNVRGEPIVCTPEQAWRCFLATDMDVLVLDRFVLKRTDQPAEVFPPREDYLAQFELD